MSLFGSCVVSGSTAHIPDVYLLAKRLIDGGPLPRKAETDALHISAAAVSGMDFLLTWNCKHIANAEMQKVDSEDFARCWF
jgi:hypothetical protein